jgi:hypothetical protein
LYIADSGNHAIRQIDITTLVVTTIVGGRLNPGLVINPIPVDGIGSNAFTYSPQGIAVDANGYIFVLEFFSCVLRLITHDRKMVTISGSPYKNTTQDGLGTNAFLGYSASLYIKDNGKLLICNNIAGRISELTYPYSAPQFVRVTDKYTNVSGEVHGIARDSRGDILYTNYHKGVVQKLQLGSNEIANNIFVGNIHSEIWLDSSQCSLSVDFACK